MDINELFILFISHIPKARLNCKCVISRNVNVINYMTSSTSFVLAHILFHLLLLIKYNK